jgi:hypothetical protein
MTLHALWQPILLVPVCAGLLAVPGDTPGALSASVDSHAPAPVISSFTPEQGPPGTWVRLTGENLADVKQVNP